MMTIDDLLARHRRIALDANAFIYLFEAPGPLARATGAILNAAELGRVTVVVSTMVLAEIAVGPVAGRDETLVEHYADAVQGARGVQVIPLTADIAVDVGIIRGRHRVQIPDAVHLATARQAGATAFITNDERMPSIPHLEVVRLADLVA
jgi:predicted nucleic acid-binding protein